jgi:hypothetical protein
MRRITSGYKFMICGRHARLASAAFRSTGDGIWAKAKSALHSAADYAFG